MLPRLLLEYLLNGVPIYQNTKKYIYSRNVTNGHESFFIRGPQNIYCDISKALHTII